MGRDVAYYIGLFGGMMLGAALSRVVLHVGGFSQVVVSVVVGLIVARMADRAYLTRHANRLADRARQTPACPRCGNARVGRFCARCGTDVGGGG
jgi:membrane-associated phospholipid phosphatase